MPSHPPPASAPRVAFQGDHGAYSEDALLLHWDGRAVPVPTDACDAVARLVAEGRVEHGLLPIENTLAGSVVATYDALAAVDGVTITGEVVLPIHHCVLALPGATLDAVRTVESHPVALAQCTRWLAAHPWVTARAAWDTAGAARDVAAAGDPTRAAIAGRGAARRLGLAVLAADVEDRADNQTRFLALARTDAAPAAPAEGTPARTALLVLVDNVPGALLHLLAPVADAGLNLSKLESRPTGEPWTYRFFVEIEHAAGDARLAEALAALRAAARAVRVLGTFGRATPASPPATPAPTVEESRHVVSR